MPVFATPPTSSYVVYDPNVFDWGFAVMDVIPTLNKAIIEREFAVVEAGQAVAVVINIQDIMTTVGQRFNFDPDTTPQIELYDPAGEELVAFTDMNFIGVTGYYNYQYQTTVDSIAGMYTARFTAENGTMTMLTDKMAVFKVTAQ